MTKIEAEKKLTKFIHQNNLTFKEGRRNNDSVIISGYASHLKIENREFMLEYLNTKFKDFDFNGEFKTTFDYARNNDYGFFWTTDEAKKMYIF
jgi:hypothetical protein